MGNVILEFYPYDFDYVISKTDTAVIRIFGLTQEGKRVVVLDDSFKPYFYALVKSTALKKAAEEITKLEVDYEGRKIRPAAITLTSKNYGKEKTSAIKIEMDQPDDIALIKDKLRLIDGYVDRVEMDIPFIRRYLIDKKLTPLSRWRVSGKTAEIRGKADYIINAESINEVELESRGIPKIIVFDIETYNPIGSPRPESDPIVMLSIASNSGLKKLLCWKRFEKAPDYVEFLDSEMGLISRFAEILKEEAPEIIAGYNSDNFDFPYVKTRAAKYKVKLDLGFDGAPLKISKKGLGVSARTSGMVHLDLYAFIKNILSPNLKTEAYNLDSVAEELVGEKKLDNINMEELYSIWDSNAPEILNFAKYCMHDSVITLKLAEKVLPIIFELTKLIGQPMFDVSRMTYGQCVEWYLIKNADKYGQFILNKPLSSDFGERLTKTYEGAYVYEPTPGIYENVVVFDFRSLYPSIIVSYNISPETIKCNCCKPTTKKEIWFCKNKGFIPSVLHELVDRRARIKEIMKSTGKEDKDYTILSARSYALKTVANAMYGYLGFARSRWYCLECAAQITALGRDYIKKVISTASKTGFNVLYADTDSLFISLGKKSFEAAEKFVETVNKKLPEAMELELQGHYPRGVFVSKKQEIEKGAKKKYALIDDRGDIIVKGFEYVRRDWSNIAKTAQIGILQIVLKENSKEKAFETIKKIIKRLKTHEVPLEDVEIYTQLTRPLDSYESIGPHVAAAMKAQKKGQKFEPGQIIKYVITTGEGSISDRAYLVNDFIKEKLEYDPEYYINNQVIPAVEKIFEVLGYSKGELVGKFQTKLGGFLKG